LTMPSPKPANRRTSQASLATVQRA
jgi:hypothetical protein